jgi:hypothetical protein
MLGSSMVLKFSTPPSAVASAVMPPAEQICGEMKICLPLHWNWAPPPRGRSTGGALFMAATTPAHVRSVMLAALRARMRPRMPW